MKSTQIVLSAAILLFSFGCKKYEDGPAISLKSKKARLTGEWELQKQTINDEEVQLIRTDTFSDQIYCTYNDTSSHIVSWKVELKRESGQKWTINKDNSVDILNISKNEYYEGYTLDDCEASLVSTTISENDGSSVQRRTWEFSEDKVNLIILDDDDNELEYRILRLTNKELSVELLKDGPVTIFDFTKN